jgi:hypothetical protein
MNVTEYRLDNTMKRRVDSRLNIITYGFLRDIKTIVYTSCMRRDPLCRSKREINMRAALKSTFNNTLLQKGCFGVVIGSCDNS